MMDKWLTNKIRSAISIADELTAKHPSDVSSALNNAVRTRLEHYEKEYAAWMLASERKDSADIDDIAITSGVIECQCAISALQFLMLSIHDELTRR